MLRIPSACAPSSIDSSPAIEASRGVRCGMVSRPTTRSIVADAMSPLIRARARELEHRVRIPSARGVDLDGDDELAVAELAPEERLALWLARRDDDLALADDEARPRASILVHGAADRRYLDGG